MLDTPAAPNRIWMDNTFLPRRTISKPTKAQGLRSATFSFHSFTKSVQVVSHVGQDMTDTRTLVKENLVMIDLFGTVHNDANVEPILQGKQLLRPFRFFLRLSWAQMVLKSQSRMVETMKSSRTPAELLRSL